MIPKYLTRILFLLLLLSSSALLHAQQPIFTHRLDSLPAPDSLPTAELNNWSFRLFRASVELRDSLRLRHRSAEAQLQSAAMGLLAAKADSTLQQDSLKNLENGIKNKRNVAKTAKELLTQAEKLSSLSARTVDADSLKKTKELPKVFKTYQQLLADAYPLPKAVLLPDSSAMANPDSSAAQAENRKNRVKEKEKKPKTASDSAVYARYEPGLDPELNPPPSGCTLLLNTRDEFSGQVRRETDKIILLSHTPAPLRPLYEGRQQVLLEAAATRLGEQVNLNLQFSIQDANARRSFGSLARGSQIILRFIDGYTITLSNSRQDEGANDAEGNAIIYRGQYALDKFQLKKVQGTALDKIRVNWSAGYEDYEVQRVDALQAIMRCMQ